MRQECDWRANEVVKKSGTPTVAKLARFKKSRRGNLGALLLVCSLLLFVIPVEAWAISLASNYLAFISIGHLRIFRRRARKLHAQLRSVSIDHVDAFRLEVCPELFS